MIPRTPCSQTNRVLSFLHLLKRILYTTFICTLIPACCHAWESYGNEIDIQCNATAERLIRCDYRLTRLQQILNIKADTNGTEIDVVDAAAYPYAESAATILLLIDTSDPARQEVISNNILQIGRILKKSEAHHRVGLASFDKNLRIDAAPGSSNDAILAAAGKLAATGKTTELYRNVYAAINLLAEIGGDRRAIYLFSDGQAEDTAYFHHDVIQAARANHVVINSLGFPRSVSLTVALQTLRRLSEESGGVYVESNLDFQLPDGFMATPFANIDNGGRFTLKSKGGADIGKHASAPITIHFTTSTDTFAVTLPDIAAVITNTPVSAETAEKPEPAAGDHGASMEPDTPNLWLWYGLPVMLTLLLGIFAISLILIYRRAKPETGMGLPAVPHLKPFAYLVSQDDPGKRHPVLSTTCRIGRGQDNELVIDDNSISRKHAEIHRYSNGNFIIFDVDSTNGIYVNNEKVSKKKLEEGDMLELGDIHFRFTLYSSDYLLDDETIVQHTRIPH